jgi:hypothetical protein
MSTLVISLPEEHMRKLEALAARFGIAPEELVRVSIEDLLEQSDDEFRRAVDYVLRKNTELYERLR